MMGINLLTVETKLSGLDLNFCHRASAKSTQESEERQTGHDSIALDEIHREGIRLRHVRRRLTCTIFVHRFVANLNFGQLFEFDRFETSNLKQSCTKHAQMVHMNCRHNREKKRISKEDDLTLGGNDECVERR